MPSCRQRVLGVDLDIDLFVKYPRERVYFAMDPRPKEADKKKWRSPFTEDQRVMAGWIYFSWCYPAGYKYAVQLDKDDNVIYDRYAGGPMVMTQDALAKFLGMEKQNVWRATKRLEARKFLRVDDGAVYPIAKPTMTGEERKALIANVEESDQLGEDPSTVPQKYRHLLNDLLSDITSEDVRTDYRNQVLELCSNFNAELLKARTERNSGIEEVCTAIASLLSRPFTFKRRSSSSQSLPPQKPSPHSQEPENDDSCGSINELYAAGAGKGALAKLPARKQRVAAWVRGVAEQCGISTDADAIDRLIRACHEAAPDIRADEIASGVRMKAEMARKKDNPIGFLITAVANLFKKGGLERMRQEAAKEQAAAAAVSERLQAKSRQAEMERELDERAEAAWNALSESEQQALVARAGKERQADKGDDGKHYRRCTLVQQHRLAVDDCRRAIRAELEAEISSTAK